LAEIDPKTGKPYKVDAKTGLPIMPDKDRKGGGNGKLAKE